MSKKNLKKTAALLLGLALTIGATGCNFIETDSARDLERAVATIDISAELRADTEKYGDEAGAIADAVSTIVGKSEISKRDLITYFLNVGSSYAQTYGYAETFNMLLDDLVNREIMIQYAVAYYLAEKGMTLEGLEEYKSGRLEYAGAEEKALLEAHPDVLTFEYFLGGKESEDYKRAEYSLKQTLNSTLDSLETQYIKAESHEHEDTSETRTMPTGVGATNADYYSTNYEIYTGRNSLADCGDYEKQDGSTTVSRRRAYNSFLTSLYSYGLISNSGGKIEDPSDIQHLDYYYVQLASSLSQALVTKYYEDLEADVERDLNEIKIVNGKEKRYVEIQFEEMLAKQEKAYANKPTAFKTAMDGVSDSSFVLYGMEDFGYVYNILIPFSATQEIEYKMYQSQGLTTNELYLKRKALWKEIRAEDQRSTWISDDEHLNYSYEKDGAYYFFENHCGENADLDQYESITHYAGTYPFQGSVNLEEGKVDGKIKDENGKLIADIDYVVDAMLNHITNVSELGWTEDSNVKTAYENMTTYTTDVKKDADGKEVEENGEKVYIDDGKVEDYTKFIYRSGKVNFATTPSAEDFFRPTSESYKVLSAVNEFVFAYSTDPGSLNSYMGYAVSPYGSGFVSEFEAAAQWAVKNGVGSWAVVPTDYGWHIIYCSFKYDEGNVYKYNHDDINVEGSFSKMFYDNLKENTLKDVTSELEKLVLNQFNNDQVVQKYPSVYEDLLEM